MRWLRRRAAPVALLVLLAGGCIGRTLPIPPPGVTAQAFTACDPTQCPAGGLDVSLSGTSVGGALIVAENLSRQFSDGHRFVASAWASNAPGADAGADAAVQGTWTLRLDPQPDGTGVLATQHGDRIELTQFVRNGDGLYQQSMSVDVMVP